MNSGAHMRGGLNPQLSPEVRVRVGVGQPPPAPVIDDIAAAELWLGGATTEISKYGGTYGNVQSAAQSIADLNNIVSGGTQAYGPTPAVLPSGDFGWQGQTGPFGSPMWGAIIGDVSNLYPSNTPGDKTFQVATWATRPAGQSLISSSAYPTIGTGLQSYPQAFNLIKSLLDELRQARATIAAGGGGGAAGIQIASLQASASAAAMAASQAIDRLTSQLQAAQAAAAAAAAACVKAGQ